MKTGMMSDLNNHARYDNSNGTIVKFRQSWYNDMAILASVEVVQWKQSKPEKVTRHTPTDFLLFATLRHNFQMLQRDNEMFK